MLEFFESESCLASGLAACFRQDGTKTCGHCSVCTGRMAETAADAGMDAGDSA